MPKIFDNIHQKFLPTLQETIKVAYRADFCIGYFRLSGWQHLDEENRGQTTFNIEQGPGSNFMDSNFMRISPHAALPKNTY